MAGGVNRVGGEGKGGCGVRKRERGKSRVVGEGQRIEGE